MWTLVYGLYDFEWDVYMPYLNEHMKLMPKLGNVGQKTIICGPESFTPDSQPIFGAESQVSYGQRISSRGWLSVARIYEASRTRFYNIYLRF